MIDCSPFHTTGMHLEAAGGAEVSHGKRFKSDGFGLTLDLNVSNSDISIFKVEKICDTIHVSSFQFGFPQNHHTEKRKERTITFQTKQD